MERAQLFYLLLLPEGSTPALPEGSCFGVEPAGGRTHWELVLDEGGPQPFVRDIEREMFIERLVATCPRRLLLSATGPVEKVFADAKEALELILGSLDGGWVNDLVAARLLSRKRALGLSTAPVAAEQLHIATYEPGPGVITRGMLKVGLPEIALKYERGGLRDAAKAVLLQLAGEVLSTGEALVPGKKRKLGDVMVEVSVPPGVYTAKIASAPSGAHDHHQHWVQRALEDTDFEPGGVIVVQVHGEKGDEITTEFLERDRAPLPTDFCEPGAQGHEDAAQGLITVLGEPDEVLPLSDEEDPDEVVHVLHYKEKVAQGGGAEVRDLYVTAGLSEKPQPGPLVDHRVELGFITPVGECAWLPKLVLELRRPYSPDDITVVQFTSGATIPLDLTDVGLEGFGGLLFIPPVFLPPEDATVTVAPPGEDAHEVLVLLVVPLTNEEMEFKASDGFEALVEKLQSKFPAGRWLVAQQRGSSV